MRPHHLQFTSETFSDSDSAVDIDKSVRVQKWSKITDGLKLVLNSKSSLLFLKVSIWSQTHFYSDWSRDYKSRTTQRPHVILTYKISLHLCLLHQMLTPLEDWTFKLGSIALKPWSWSTLIWDTTWAHCVYFLLWDVPVFLFFLCLTSSLKVQSVTMWHSRGAREVTILGTVQKSTMYRFTVSSHKLAMCSSVQNLYYFYPIV